MASNTQRHKNGRKQQNYFPYIAILLIVTLLSVVFFPALNYNFVNWDDTKYVYENELITSFSWENIKYFFTNYYFLMYLPITMLTYMLDYLVNGYDPSVFHTTSLVFHILNSCLVFVFTAMFLKALKFKHTQIPALFIALLFGIHAMHVESVVWIAERKDLVYTLFYFISLILYLKYTDNSNPVFYIVSVFAFLLSLISKAQAMPLVFIIIGMDFLLGRDLRSRKIILEKIPFFLLTLIFGYIAILATRSKGTENVDYYPFVERVLYAGYGYVMYLVKLIFPYNLSAIYPFPDKFEGGLPWYLWIFPVLTALIAAGFFVSLFKQKFVAFSIWFYTVSIIIVLQIFSYHNVLMADRYSYVSSVGLFLLFAFLYEKILGYKPQLKTILIVIMVAFIGLHVYKTRQRLPVWKDSIALWSDVISKHSNVATAFYNRGVEYFDRKEFEKAKSDFEAVLQLDSESSGAQFSLGNLYSEINKLNKALSYYNKAIAIDSTDMKYYANRGIAYAKTGNVQDAINDFNRVISVEPDNPNAYSNRGNTKIMTGDYKGAIDDYTKAINLKPDYTDPLYNRGTAYFNLKQYDKAIEDLKRTLIFEPNHFKSYFYIGTCYDLKGDPQKAIDNFTKAVKINPKYTEAYFNRGNVNLKTGNYNEAIKDYSATIQLLPKHGLPYYQRGLAYMNAGNRDNACKDFQQSLQLGFKAAANELNKYCRK